MSSFSHQSLQIFQDDAKHTIAEHLTSEMYWPILEWLKKDSKCRWLGHLEISIFTHEKKQLTYTFWAIKNETSCTSITFVFANSIFTQIILFAFLICFISCNKGETRLQFKPSDKTSSIIWLGWKIQRNPKTQRNPNNPLILGNP